MADGHLPREPWRAVRVRLRYVPGRVAPPAREPGAAATGAAEGRGEHCRGSGEGGARDVACWRGRRRW